MWISQATRSEIVLASFALLALVGCSSTGRLGQSPSSSSSSPTISVNGPANVRVGSPAQYAAQIEGLSDDEVVWSVSGSGSTNGASALGSISSSGLYTPPATPTTSGVMISAASVADPGLRSSVAVQLLNPLPQISTAAVAVVPPFSFALTINGTNFVPGSTITIGSSSVIPSSVSPITITAMISMASLQNPQISVQVANPNPGAGTSNIVTANIPQTPATVTAATRILDQATFGPTFNDIAHVQQVGISSYVDEQLALAPSVMPGITTSFSTMSLGCGPFYQCEPDGYWTQFAVFGPDQLRQRVAFALSKLWTVSYFSTPPQYFPYLLNVFASDAFGSWRRLMEDVTLSGAMGNYLNMANNMVSGPSDKENENYGREVMQVFNLGPSRLNSDGSLQLDANGNPIPVYSQDQVDGFARAFTGWTYAKNDCSAPTGPQIATTQVTPGSMCPMVALEAYHDHNAKQLLDNTVLPASQSASQDLEDALDNIFYDSNAPPYIAKILIQNLVKSNPSPDYVSRIAAVFADNGSGIRGDLRAVVRAILLDPEARYGDDPTVTDSSAGHLRDPILLTTAITRALNPSQVGDYSAFAPLDYIIMASGETLHQAPSVFGYYPQSFTVPGTSQLGPEFYLETIPNVTGEINFLDRKVLTNALGPSSNGATILFDLSQGGQLGTFASQGVGPFLDAMNILFFHGKMTSQEHTAMESALKGLSPVMMVRAGVYIAGMSPEFRVIQ